MEHRLRPLPVRRPAIDSLWLFRHRRGRSPCLAGRTRRRSEQSRPRNNRRSAREDHPPNRVPKRAHDTASETATYRRIWAQCGAACSRPIVTVRAGHHWELPAASGHFAMAVGMRW